MLRCCPLALPTNVDIRLQGPVKSLDGASFQVKVNGLVKNQSVYTLEDLQKRFQKVEIVAAMQVPSPFVLGSRANNFDGF